MVDFYSYGHHRLMANERPAFDRVWTPSIEEVIPAEILEGELAEWQDSSSDSGDENKENPKEDSKDKPQPQKKS